MTSDGVRDEIDIGFDDAIMLEEHFVKKGIESGKVEAIERCKTHGYVRTYYYCYDVDTRSVAIATVPCRFPLRQHAAEPSIIDLTTFITF